MLKKLVRRGECKHCAKCCVGCALYGRTIVRGEERLCPEFDKHPDCERWPTHPQDIGFELQDVCGYRFYDAETGRRVVRRPIPRTWFDDEYWEVVMQGYARTSDGD